MPVRGNQRKSLVGAALATVAGMIVVLATSLDRPAALHAPGRDLPTMHHTTPPPPTSHAVRSPSVPPTPTAPESTSGSLSWTVANVLAALAALALLIALGVLTWNLWRNWRDRRALAEPPVPEADMRQVQDRLHRAAASGLSSLDEGEADEAIVRAWIGLLDAIDDAGIAVRPHETPTELVLRVGADSNLPHDPLDDLAALYREARFSRHTMGERQRERAREDLSILVGVLHEAGTS